MPVLNLDRVLLANSDTCHLVSSKPQISSCFFKNNTCFTFNTKFAISLHIIRILVPGFLKNYSCLTLKQYIYSIQYTMLLLLSQYTKLYTILNLGYTEFRHTCVYSRFRPAWQASPWGHRPSSSAPCAVPMRLSRIDQHIKDEPCARQRALLGVFSSRSSSVSRPFW